MLGAKGLVLLATIIALVTVLWVNATRTSLPIEYIQSPVYGDFMRTPGQVISASDTHYYFTAAAECHCRIACFSHPLCKSVSIEPLNGEVLCRLSWYFPQNCAIENNTDAVYIFRLSSYNIRHLGIESDGFLYMIINIYRTFDDAKYLCEMIPGYRLGMFHSVAQYNSLKKMQQKVGTHLWVDMERTNQGAIWGDGTLFQDTPVANITTLVNEFPDSGQNYAASTNIFLERNSSVYLLTVCQANPYGLDW